MKTAKTDVIVELHVDDFEKVKDFYGKLGFEIVWERKPEGKKGYLVLKRGESVLCFWSGNREVVNQEYFSRFPQDTKKGFGVEVILMVNDIDSLYEKVKTFANVVEKLKVKPWGLKDFRMEDPFGFYLRITEPYDTLDKANAVK